MTEEIEQQEAQQKFESMEPLEFPLEFGCLVMSTYEHGCYGCEDTVTDCRGRIMDFNEVKVLDIVTRCDNCGSYYDAPKLKFDSRRVYIYDEGAWHPLSPSILMSIYATVREWFRILKEKITGN